MTVTSSYLFLNTAKNPGYSNSHLENNLQFIENNMNKENQQCLLLEEINSPKKNLTPPTFKNISKKISFKQISKICRKNL